MMRASSVTGAVRWVGWMLATALAAPAAPGPSEYELKAAYLFNILRFVDRRTPAPAGEHFTLCLSGAEVIEQSLLPLAGNAMHGRKFRIRAVNAEPDLTACDAVFFGHTAARSNRLFHKAVSLDLLTIGNDEEFIVAGGMLALVLDARRVIVEVNEAALSSRSWSFSSHLLEVARLFRGGA